MGMTNKEQELIIYATNDGKTQVEVRMTGDFCLAVSGAICPYNFVKQGLF